MKTLACGFLLAALAGTAQAGPGDDMQFLPESLPVLAWSNCIPGTTCTVLRARDCPTQAWEAVDSVVATSGVTEIPLPAGIEPTCFVGVQRPLDLDLGLVAHYRFEGSADDSSGYANHGTNNGVAFVEGRNGDCGWFNGSSHIRIPQSDSLRITSDMTLAAWILPLHLGDLHAIVDKDYEFNGYNLYTDGAGIHMRINSSALTAGSVSTSRWFHVGGVYTGDKIRIFVDGQQRGETDAGTLINRDKDVFLGVWGPPGYFTRFYVGYMDDVRIYNRALTPNEMQALGDGAE